jgi:hypothetical protein
MKKQLKQIKRRPARKRTSNQKGTQLYSIPVTWSMAGDCLVRAKSLDEAIAFAEKNSVLPGSNNYVDDSYQVLTDAACDRYPNENQQGD